MNVGLNKRTYQQILTVLSGGLLLIGALSACSGPKYPNCAKDDDCTTHQEVCVNKQCQECREDTQCNQKYPGRNYLCKTGRCEAKPECLNDKDCQATNPHAVCQNQKCINTCTTDYDCEGETICNNGQCVVSSFSCKTDKDCTNGRSCVKGFCNKLTSSLSLSAECKPQVGSKEIVSLKNINFDFNHYELTDLARNTLDQNVACLKQAATIKIIVEGHCDERGTQEYNLALGEKRANTVANYLRNLGIKSSRIQVISKGENEPLCTTSDEACWAKNRRVQFIQKLSDNK